MEYLIDFEWLLGLNGFSAGAIYIVEVTGRLGSHSSIFLYASEDSIIIYECADK